MNLVRIGFLTVLLLASSAFGQDKPKGYDLGECSPDGFVAVHVSPVGNDLKMDLYSPGPDKVKKFDGPLYKFTSEDAKGKHYVYVDEDGSKLQMTIPATGNGTFEVDNTGQDSEVMFVIQDDDGSNLAENAKKEFQSCKDHWNGPEQMKTDKA